MKNIIQSIFVLLMTAQAFGRDYNGVSGYKYIGSGITENADGSVTFENPSINKIYFSSELMLTQRGAEYTSDPASIATLICQRAGLTEVVSFEIYRTLQYNQTLRRNPSHLLMFDTRLPIFNVVHAEQAIKERSISLEPQTVALGEGYVKEHFMSLTCK